MYAGRTESEKTYYGCITQMDEQLGRLFAYLRDKGLWEKTVIIFTSDNGPEPPVNIYHHDPGAPAGSTGGFRGSKHVIYEGGIREPGHRALARANPSRARFLSIPVTARRPAPHALPGNGTAPVPAGFHYDRARRPAEVEEPAHPEATPAPIGNANTP